MSTSRRALLSILSATVAFAAIIGIASAKGGGGGGSGGKHSVLSSVTTGTSPTHVKPFKSFAGKACRNWPCPITPPISKCVVQSNIDQSFSCNAKASSPLTNP